MTYPHFLTTLNTFVTSLGHQIAPSKTAITLKEPPSAPTGSQSLHVSIGALAERFSAVLESLDRIELKVDQLNALEQ